LSLPTSHLKKGNYLYKGSSNVCGETNVTEGYNNIADFIKSDEIAREELRKRGVIVQIGKPELKVVGE